ncbi:MAG: aspartate aminotransferase family protein [Lachnospiraceae bacterium]|nr:aspartate aminotransferase family protein [Lachnospiraceae bacterium]
MQDIINTAEEHLIHTYNRYPLVLEKGEGVYLYDNTGKKYLDFSAGIAVFALGYNDKRYNDALKAQVDKLIHTSNYYYSKPMAKAAENVTKASGLDKVFFCNSGTEALEGAVKVARKYATKRAGYNEEQPESEIIAMEHSFHGRSTGALAITGNPKYQKDFRPLMPGVKFAKFNDLESVKALVTKKTVAIVMEPVQGEGGIYPATKEFIEGVRALCDEKDMLLIFDEVQCGMGRSGAMYACQKYGVKPDVLTTAKALGCGVPVGAFVVGGKAKDVLEAGDHGSTYGGNPLVTAAINEVFEIFAKDRILDHVNEVAPYLEEQLDALAAKFDCIKERRGLGLMQGLEFSVPVGDIVKKAMDNGLILISAGTHIIRFVPPLVITKENVDEMIAILEKSIETSL